jgi:hypothetical protein
MSIKDLKELHDLMQQGVITPDEFEEQKKNILKSGKIAGASPAVDSERTSMLDIFSRIEFKTILPIVALFVSFVGFSILFLTSTLGYDYNPKQNFLAKFSLLCATSSFIAFILMQSLVHFKAWARLPNELRTINPDKAVVYLFIPFAALYWVFPSFYGLAKQVNKFRIQQGLRLKRFNEELFLLFGALTVLCFIVLVTLDVKFMLATLRIFAYNFETLFYFLVFWGLAGLYISFQENSLLLSTAANNPESSPLTATTQRESTDVYAELSRQKDFSDLLDSRNVTIIVGIAIIVLTLAIFWLSSTLNPIHTVTRILFLIYGILLIIRPSLAPMVLLLTALGGIGILFYYLIAHAFTSLEPEKYRPIDTLILPSAQFVWLVLFHKAEITGANAIGLKAKILELKDRINLKRLTLGLSSLAILVGSAYYLINHVNWRSNYLRINAYAQVKSSDGMVLRLGPSIKDKAVLTIRNGQMVYVTGEGDAEEPFFGIKSKWYMVEYRGRSGWMWGGLSVNETTPQENGNPSFQRPPTAKVAPAEVTASGYLEQPSMKYHPMRVLDGQKDTTWADSKPNAPGIGEWLKFDFKAPARITHIGIVNGLHRKTSPGNNDAYILNGSPKTIRIEFSTGYSTTVQLDRTREMQFISFPEQNSVASVTMTIISEYPGLAYQDTCISEVEFF